MAVDMVVEREGIPSSRENGAGRLSSPVADYLALLHARYAHDFAGEVAAYIPELAKADPSWFGICLVTVDGTVYEIGDTRQRFTIQSISKPLTYGLVLDDHGEEAVRKRIGVEPTGDAFNSISLAPETGVPFNAMINAGAIASASLVAATQHASPIDRVLETYSRYAGRPLALDWTVYESENASGHRNRAIGHLLRNSGVVQDDPEPVIQRYFQQCSALVDCRDLGTIAATLANGGRNPLTGERVAREQTVRSVLSVMTTCGMYDSAGEWLYSVGLPAKSGVSGGVLAVLPGHLGIGIFSPPLDPQGNSVRGVSVCRDLSRDLDLHLVQSGGRSAPPIRAAYHVGEIGSKRRRSERERMLLERLGPAAVAFELQGEISFPAAEAIAGEVIRAAESARLVVLEMRRVGRVSPSAATILVGLVRRLAAHDRQLAVSGVNGHAEFVSLLQDATEAARTFAELDLALEWCENTLLEASGVARDPVRIGLAEHELLRGLTDSQIEQLAGRLEPRSFRAGALVLRRGDPANEMFLITSGELSVTIDLPSGGRKRLATVSPGMLIGELASLSRETRSADVWADTEVECFALAADELARLGESDAALKCALLENLLSIVGTLARRTNDELVRLAA